MRGALVGLSMVLALLAPAARADEPEVPDPTESPAPPARYRVPEEAWSALTGREVRLVYEDGHELVGRLIASDGTSLVLEVVATRDVTTVEKSQVVAVRVVEEPERARRQSALADRYDLRPRVGIHVGAVLVTEIDFQVGHFYCFTSASPFFTLFTLSLSGGSAATGLGYTMPFARDWHLDLLAFGGAQWLPGIFGETLGSLGLGIGLRYTRPGGFELGMKAPLVGVGIRESLSSAGSEFIAFYLFSGISLPLLSFGYRF
jgi:hypothetical protein